MKYYRSYADHYLNTVFLQLKVIKNISYKITPTSGFINLATDCNVAYVPGEQRTP